MAQAQAEAGRLDKVQAKAKHLATIEAGARQQTQAQANAWSLEEALAQTWHDVLTEIHTTQPQPSHKTRIERRTATCACQMSENPRGARGLHDSLWALGSHVRLATVARSWGARRQAVLFRALATNALRNTHDETI